jgi:toxic protein SymE
MTKSVARTHVRTIKTGRNHFPVVPTRSNNFTGFRRVPWIRLGGVWLEEAGFKVGAVVKIEVWPGRVVIRTE